MRQILNRLKLIFAACAFVLTTAMSSGGAVLAAKANDSNPPGNNGTLKIHKQGSPVGFEDNQPKVCVFNVEGFGFDAGQTGYLMFNVQGQDAPIGTPAGPFDFGATNSDGYYATDYFHLDPGHYKAVLYGKQLPNGSLKDVKAKSKVFKVDCGTQSKEVTPTKPAESTPTCENPNMTVTPPSIEGVLWSPADSTVLKPGESVTYTARADTANGYVLAQHAETSWTFENNFNPSECNNNCGCIGGTVTPGEVKFKDVCGVENDAYYIPKTSHIKYYVNGSNTAETPGWHNTNGAGIITVVAKAAKGYEISGQHEWSRTFTDEPCVAKVKPKKVKFIDVCGTENDKYMIPSQRGVEYWVNGSKVEAGTYPAEGEVEVKALALDSFQLKGQTLWTHTFTDEKCGGGGHGGGPVEITPGAVTFANITCELNGHYTIPETPGVIYKDAEGNVLTAGKHYVKSAQTVKVYALPADESYVLSGNTHEWTHKFKVPTNCESGGGGGTVTPPKTGGFVLGESTTLTGGKGAGEVLANTGVNTLVTTLMSILMVTGALALYAYRPKVELQ